MKVASVTTRDRAKSRAGLPTKKPAKRPPEPKLRPEAVSAQPLRVPVAVVNRLLTSSARLVADLPQGVSGDVVWTRGDAELLVRTHKLSLACAPGLVLLSIAVACDQVPRGATVVVPLAVGSEERPAGLVMSAFARPAGPDVICSLWSEALTAFAWEVLLHLAQTLCGTTGKDAEGRALVLASIASARNVLVLQPVARNELSRRTDGRQ